MNEIYIQNFTRIVKGLLNYSPPPTQFYANMAGYKGPTPGSITVTTAGTTVNLSQLTTPGGICILWNTDPVNYVEYGIIDPAFPGKWDPFLEILPGESYQHRLSRRLGSQESTGTGTHPIGSGVLFHMKAVGGPVDMIVFAFDG
jgi:hypothetical protein